ncbi:hypothetical protein NITGR_590037 [Nitrospina gracilis 3/211]|uniref:Uncharacterized protein n=1 Tax=Nitrospina gracilis (strain 3/211) TaxID=1266370 RepID=M1YL39_NITG3|nr:hypothetical protein NITGR_590037 [Nitrospina gracilis 3/211]
MVLHRPHPSRTRARVEPVELAQFTLFLLTLTRTNHDPCKELFRKAPGNFFLVSFGISQKENSGISARFPGGAIFLAPCTHKKLKVWIQFK